MPARPARLPVGSIGHEGRGRARARTGQRAVGHNISESAPGPARPPPHRRWGPCRWERHWVDSLERAGRGTRRAGGPGPHRRPMAGPSTRTSSTTGSPRSSWQAPGRNLRAIFCVSPHSSPFNRARKSPHKTWNSPAFPANQTSVFAHHVLILLQPAHGAHVFQPCELRALLTPLPHPISCTTLCTDPLPQGQVSVHFLAFSVRPGGPAHLRSAPLASGAAARGDVLPARGPLPPATGRYGPRGVFTHQAGVRCTWGDVPPARGPPPSATGRYGPRGVFTHRAGARCAWGDVPPGSRPASTCNRALRPAWRLRSSSRCPQHLGGRAPPDRGPPLPATEHYGSRGAFTLQSWCSHRLGERLPRLAARIYSLPGATARVASPLIKPGGRRPLRRPGPGHCRWWS